MQKLNPEHLKGYDHDSAMQSEEFVPAIEGAEFYFSLVNHNGRKILCLLDDSGQWRPTSYQEMMSLSR